MPENDEPVASGRGLRWIRDDLEKGRDSWAIAGFVAVGLTVIVTGWQIYSAFGGFVLEAHTTVSALLLYLINAGAALVIMAFLKARVATNTGLLSLAVASALGFQTFLHTDFCLTEALAGEDSVGYGPINVCVPVGDLYDNVELAFKDGMDQAVLPYVAALMRQFREAFPGTEGVDEASEQIDEALNARLLLAEERKTLYMARRDAALERQGWKNKMDALFPVLLEVGGRRYVEKLAEDRGVAPA